MNNIDIKKRERSETFGASYGATIPGKSGIVTDITTLPNKTFFYVHNGGWQGYIERESDKCIIYCGASQDNPTQKYVHKLTIPFGYTFDALITVLDNKVKHTILLTEDEINCFLSYIESDDMKTAFGNSDWRYIFNKITNGKKTDKIQRMIDGE